MNHTAADAMSEIENRAGKLGLTITDVSRLSGVNRSTFTRWKAGNHKPTSRLLQLVNSALETAEAKATEATSAL